MPIPLSTFDTSGFTLLRRNGFPGSLIRLIVICLGFIVGVGLGRSIIVYLGLALVRKLGFKSDDLRLGFGWNFPR